MLGAVESGGGAGGPGRAATLALALSLALLGLAPALGGDPPAPPPPVAVAIIVHPQNPLLGVSPEELQRIFLMKQQFWDGGGRIVLLLRPSGLPEKDVLLSRVYRMTEAELRKYWTMKLYAGEIPAIPSVVQSAPAANAAVRDCPEAITAVVAGAVEPGVRVLAVDGKKPGDEGYQLVYEVPR